jgi:hypothetical protein
LEQTLGVEIEIPTRGVESPVTQETKSSPPKPQSKKRMNITPRKIVRADDPYL